MPIAARLEVREKGSWYGNDNNTKVISFSIFKGGPGKTTSSVNTAVALARRGKRVLLVDLDQQASSTRYLDLDPDEIPSLYEVYMGAKPAALAIKHTRFGVEMLTANTLLAAIEEALEPGDELKLSEFLTPLRPSYDFILVDTPPGKAMLAFNGLAAADLIIIPASAERMALEGVADTIGYIQRHLWGKYPALEHQELRILFTMYRNTTAHAPAVVASAQKIWRENIFGVRIPHAAIFAQSYDQKQPRRSRSHRRGGGHHRADAYRLAPKDGRPRSTCGRRGGCPCPASKSLRRRLAAC